MVDELHLKLRKLENNSEENSSMNTRATATSASSSPIAPSSKLHKNLKKIKRNHGGENPTKNYYLAFPALSGNKKATSSTMTSTRTKGSLVDGEEEDDKNLLSWSNLMTKSENSLPIQQEINRNKTPQQRRKQKRFEKACRRLPKATNAIDVQFATKSFDLYESATFSPKKMPIIKTNNANTNKKAKHQRNNYGKSK